MSKALYNSPRIKRSFVTVLYHEARLQKARMTFLTNPLLERINQTFRMAFG